MRKLVYFRDVNRPVVTCYRLQFAV